MADPKEVNEELETSPEEGELSTEELNKVTGGVRDNDPCEGGQFHSR